MGGRRRLGSRGNGGFSGCYARLSARDYWNHLQDRGYVEQKGNMVRVTNFGRMPTGSMAWTDAGSYRRFRSSLIEVFDEKKYISKSVVEKLINEAYRG